jgi:hypothetical protein
MLEVGSLWTVEANKSSAGTTTIVQVEMSFKKVEAVNYESFWIYT